MGWVTDDAPTRLELDACVTCGLCLPHCPTYRLTGDEAASPRGRLTAMAAVGEGLAVVDETFENIMGFCLQCRACEAVCPSMVPFGRVMEGARTEITVQRPSATRRLRHRLVGDVLARPGMVRLGTRLAAVAQRLRLDRLGGLPGRLRGLRRLPLAPPVVRGRRYEPANAPVGTVALLAGCVMEPWFGDVHTATVEVLRLAGYAVEVPATQTCCGALAAHDGAAEATRALAERNIAAFAGYDVVVVDAAGCGAHLKDYAHWGAGGADLARRVRDVTEVVDELLAAGRLPAVAEARGDVAVQDPCHLRHAQRIVTAPRRVLRAAGYTPIDIDPAGLCCGAAGLYTILEADTSEELGRRKAAEVRSTGAPVVASANPGCEMQLRTHLGSEATVAHPVELYWQSLQLAGLARPGGGS